VWVIAIGQVGFCFHDSIPLFPGPLP